MPEEPMTDYIEQLGIAAPELLFVIGVVAILAYVAIKVIPLVEKIKTQKLTNEAEHERMVIEVEQRREQRKAEEFKKEMERDRARTEVIGKQNEIIESLTRAADAQTLQMAGLIASLEESKVRSRTMSDTVEDTNHKVSEIHTMIVKAGK